MTATISTAGICFRECYVPSDTPLNITLNICSQIKIMKKNLEIVSHFLLFFKAYLGIENIYCSYSGLALAYTRDGQEIRNCYEWKNCV